MTHVVRTQPRRRLGGWLTLALAQWLPICLSVGLVGSCTRDNVTSPSGSPRSPGDPPSRTTTTLGTYTMPIAATNTDNNGALSLTPTGYIIPANSYFRIRIRGNVILTSNPAYIAAYGSNCCSENGTYGPGGTAYVNELRVQAQIKYTDNSGTVGVNFPGLGSGPSAPDSAVSAITFTSKPAEVWIGRNGVNGSQNDNCCHWNIGMYSMAGSQTATVEVLTDFVHLTPSPVYKKAGQVVHFQMALDDGTPATVWQWSWTKDPGSNANPLSGCANGWDFCDGTVWGPGTLSGRTDYGWASARVNVYNNFTVTADTTSVHPGDSVTFTSKYDGITGPAARWRWIPDDTSSDHAGCPDGSSGCRKLIHGPGTMWAYTATSGGDSASAHVGTVARRRLMLNPVDTVWVENGSTQEFLASGEGGAAVLNPVWSGSDIIILADLISRRPSLSMRPSPGGRRAQSLGNASSSTCVAGVTDCSDVVNGSYTRAVTATVDDSLQSASVVVISTQLIQADVADSSCFASPGTCWSGETIDGDAAAGPYRAPQSYVKTQTEFRLDFTDQHDKVHVFYLTNASFSLVTVLDSTSKHVDALYRIVGFSSQRSSVPGESLLREPEAQVPIRSTLVETFPGTFVGGFSQNNRAGGTFWGWLKFPIGYP
jgi:hypothetical protein